MLGEGTELAGYRIERVLGTGGMATVYEATQLSLDRRVALKVMGEAFSGDAEFRARFKREALLQAGLDHDHVVAVHEAGEAGALLNIAMRLIRGPNLKELIRAGALDDTRVFELLIPVADALDTAHQAGLVHRDVKPQNILVGPRDHAFLSDFGLTKTAEHTALTATGRFMGTPHYTSPEQVQGEAATPASDVYAFAAVVYECLTGSVPFRRPSEAALLFAHVADEPPVASAVRPGLSRAVDEALRRGMAKRPEDRPPTATELMREVQAGLASGESETVDAPSAAPTPPRPTKRLATRRRLPRAGTIAALAAVPVAAVAAILLVGGDDEGDGGGASGGNGQATTIGSPWLGEAKLGATLAGGDPVRRETCFGSGDADACTVAQRHVAREAATAPFDGVITRWRVRHARGDVTLRVLRAAGRRPVLQRSSSTERASGTDVNAFETCLAIAEGDLIGLSVGRDGRFGIVWTTPAGIYRWDAEEPTRDTPLDRIAGVELLLDADLERPGACEP